jgi:hypothetical protein
MSDQFNSWWNSDDLLKDNPYRIYTPAYWAWEGWCAAIKAEREECAKLCEEPGWNAANWCAKQIRARGQA